MTIQRLFIFLLLLLTACQKKSVEANQSASNYFPNKVGDTWVYSVYDSSQIPSHSGLPRKYDVKVSIISTQKMLDGLDASVWKYQYPNASEIKYVRIVGDTVKVFDTAYSRTLRDFSFPREIYIIPFSGNQKWEGSLLFVDSSFVTTVPQLITDYSIFTNCYKILHYYLGPNMEYRDRYWFKPNVGIIKYHKYQYNSAPFNIELWQLKNYQLQ